MLLKQGFGVYFSAKKIVDALVWGAFKKTKFIIITITIHIDYNTSKAATSKGSLHVLC